MSKKSTDKNAQDGTKPAAPEDEAASNEQRRFRGLHKPDQRTAADARRGEIAGEETSEDAPMDAEDKEFLKSK
jgi:hypothetical protein